MKWGFHEVRMRNFARINNYYNNIEAKKDWQKIKKYAEDLGLFDIVKKYEIDDSWGWRKIDKSIKMIRDVIEKEINKNARSE